MASIHDCIRDEGQFLDRTTVEWLRRVNAQYALLPEQPRLLVAIQDKLGNDNEVERTQAVLDAFELEEGEKGNITLLVYFRHEQAFYLKGGNELVPYTPEQRLDALFIEYMTDKEDFGEQPAFSFLLEDIVMAINKRHGIVEEALYQAPLSPTTTVPPGLGRLLGTFIWFSLVATGAFIAWGGWLAFLIVLSVGSDILLEIQAETSRLNGCRGSR